MTTTIRPCTHCGHPLRPQGTSIDDYPDTLARYRKGRCRDCAPLGSKRESRKAIAKIKAIREERYGHHLPPAPPGLTGEDLRNRQQLEQLILDRRRRGIPTKGIDPDVWACTTRTAA